MTQLKLDVYLEILKTVAFQNSINPGKIASYTKTAVEITKQSLTFLLSQGLIELNQNGSYKVAHRGLAVLRYFGLIEERPQAIENF